MDLFDFYRYLLGTVVTIYAAVTTAQSAISWYNWLAQGDRHILLVRRYVITSGLRLRLTSFWADALVSLLLCLVFVMLWHAHGTVAQIAAALTDGHRRPKPIH